MATYKVLFFSTHEWSDLWRRRQRLAYQLSLQPDVASVLYVNPPIQTSVLDLARGRFQNDHLAPTRRQHLHALLGRPNQAAPGVWVYTGSQKTLPLSRFGVLRESGVLNHWNRAAYTSRLRACLERLPGEQLVLYLSHPLHDFALDAFNQRALACYDWTDDWMQFELLPLADRAEYARRDRRVPREVDLVFTVSTNLFERARGMNLHTHWLPNATSLLDQPAGASDPDGDVAACRGPRLGYVGHIGDRVDFGLIESLALARPDCSIVMIGPVWSNRASEAERLGQLPNVHFLGPRPYATLLAILGQFDVCLIPHTLDQLTLSMDPIKLYDYLACGKPIVTTRVSGVERFSDVLRTADTPTDFIEAVGAALLEADFTMTERRREYARNNAWPARAAEFWGLIQQRLAATVDSTVPQPTHNASFRTSV